MSKPINYGMRFIHRTETGIFLVRIGSKNSHYRMNRSFNPRKYGGILKAKKKPRFSEMPMRKYTTEPHHENYWLDVNYGVGMFITWLIQGVVVKETTTHNFGMGRSKYTARGVLANTGKEKLNL